MCASETRKLLVFAFILALFSVSPKLLAESDSQAREIDKVVSRYAEYGYLNGTVLVAEHGQVLYAKGVGEANIEKHVPNTTRTKFGIASLTKQFAAALVLQEVAEGKIRLDAKVSDYLPWYRKDTGGRITIEQLLHHTAGLPSDYDMPEFGDSEAAARRYEPEAFAQKFCQQDLVSEPGTKWAYSNCGYNLLGLILERVTGKPFGELLRGQLLDPLGMKDTGLDRNDLVQLGGAVGYLRHAGARYTLGSYQDRIHFFSAGGMYSTAEDLLRWSEALNEGGLVAKEIREQMFAPGLNHWGYGWFITKIGPRQTDAGETLQEMRGDMTGHYFAWILRYPERDAVIIVLRNGYGSTEGLEQNLQAILFDEKPRMPKRSPKDVAAKAWFGAAEWVESHGAASAGIAVGVILALWIARRAMRKARAA